MLVLNVSIGSVLNIREYFASLRRLRRPEQDADEEEEPEDEDTYEEEEEMPPPRAERESPAASEESLMTSRQRRKTEIPLDLLDDRRSEPKAGDVDRNQEIIARTFANFGIDVEMSDVRVGPTVTHASGRRREALAYCGAPQRPRPCARRASDSH
jgi:DNA segregation ATPase FtsK/SpoIIIE-like protein